MKKKRNHNWAENANGPRDRADGENALPTCATTTITTIGPSEIVVQYCTMRVNQLRRRGAPQMSLKVSSMVLNSRMDTTISPAIPVKPRVADWALLMRP